MPKYNYLHNNESDFPILDNVNVYKYDNDFDYGRFNATQMGILLCSVPWDMGEAHVGNRTISGIGNVVYFGSKSARDAWFNAIPDSECYRFETKYKELHREHVIDVPVPFDMASKHNYLVVEYNLFANDKSPVMYEGDDGHRKWFWFIREVEFIAPNVTRLHLLEDAWQTWIYDVSISGMMLERGHAPMFKTRVDDYLANPLANNTYLLCEDVNFGEASQVKHIDVLGLNAGTMYACIATTANVKGTWGTKANDDWRVPANAAYTTNGVPSVYVFACAASNLSTLLSNIDSSYPQMKQTIQAVWFVSSDLITLSTAFTFASVTCYPIVVTRKTLNLCKLNKSMFGYGGDYANIAKLYTSPYAHIEITDENGNPDIVKIEDTTGDIDVSTALSIAYPFITLEAHLKGIGGNASATVTFKNIDSHTFPVAGQWYETLRTWQVPTFAVVLDPAKEYDYSTHFDRAQRVVEYTAAKNNADANADTLKSNADANADNTTANAALAVAANTAVTAASDLSAAAFHVDTVLYNVASATHANTIVDNNATSTIAAADAQGAIAATTSAVSAAAGAIGAAASGNPAGAVSAVISGVVGAGSTLASTAVANALTAAQAANAHDANNYNSSDANSKDNNDTQAQITCQDSIRDANNTSTSGQAANSSATQKANATRDRDTIKANATRDKNAAQSAITNDTAQAALRAPFMYGEFSNGDNATTKPMALFAHIVTQSKAAIETAGDEFLRYGYMLDRYWEFNGNWNVGKYFTYWKLRDFWVTNLNVPDMYMDRLRFFLFGGVTVWRNPSDIGKRSIYDNFTL